MGSSADTIRGIPLVGDIAGGMGVKTDAEKKKQKALEEMLEMLQAYRPQAMQMRQNSIDQAVKLFQPVNRSLSTAYGAGAQLPTAEAAKNPADGVMTNFADALAKKREAERAAEVKKRKAQIEESWKPGLHGSRFNLFSW